VYSKRDVLFEKRPSHIPKETCAYEDLHTTFDERPMIIQKEMLFSKTDPQTKRDTVFESRPTDKKRRFFRKQTHRHIRQETYVYSKRDVDFENRPTDISKETYVYARRPINMRRETYMYENRPTCTQKETSIHEMIMN